MKLIYLSLGSNLGSRKQHLEEAVRQIQNRIGVSEHISRVYESEAWGYASRNRFYNCCLSVRTGLQPIQVLDQILAIEKEMGRERTGKGYSDRIIDIDLLLYGDIQLKHSRLIIPHPSMGERRFVLTPLAGIAPDLIHPVTGISISQMLEQCADQTSLELLPYALLKKSSSQNM